MFWDEIVHHSHVGPEIGKTPGEGGSYKSEAAGDQDTFTSESVHSTCSMFAFYLCGSILCLFQDGVMNHNWCLHAQIWTMSCNFRLDDSEMERAGSGVAVER